VLYRSLSYDPVREAAPLLMTYACTLADGKVVQVGTVSLPTS